MTPTAGRLIGAVAATLAIMFVVPFPFYAGAEALGLVELPQDGSPAQFVLSVLVMKIGVALGFVFLFILARPAFKQRWWLYAGIWWVMYAIVEVGQAIGPGYTGAEAVAGILAEAVYFPLSTVVVGRILGRN
ncbi:MAG: hypothetical protein HKM89_02085 [Gemmatimonadales bacterium]|nr:hypothetical protein [Gemmatimonadales bacterium]